MFKESYLHSFGTALPLLDIDQVPSKKMVHVQNQVATDEQGRRRFHGAFTGGFSAGYWNTVGSKEGWTPQSFKSSRTEKAPERLQQQPDDFMDDEDRHEYGIAPKALQVNEDYTAADIISRKQKRKLFQANLCDPVLQQLIQPVKDKISARILKVWGWRPGQGVGPRKTQKEKKQARKINQKELYLLKYYDYEVLDNSANPFTNINFNCKGDESDDDIDSDGDNNVTFAPDDYELPPCISKNNRYGLGYVPLSRASVLGGIISNDMLDENKPSPQFSKPLEVLGKNNKKFSFSGHAFGVGALEEDDDEDIYAMDDMTRYDFSGGGNRKSTATINQKTIADRPLEYEEFLLDDKPEVLPVYKTEIPFGWQPRSWLQRKSRFEPLAPEVAKQLDRVFNVKQSKVTREQRKQLLDETANHSNTSLSKSKTSKDTIRDEKLPPSKQKKEEIAKSLLDKISLNSSNFTRGGLHTKEEMMANESNMNENGSTNSSAFKPFLYDASKQERYEKFLAANLTGEEQIQQFLTTIQPIELSPWDRNVEMHEFMQAKRLYRPLNDLMSERFISESEIIYKETIVKEKCMEAVKVTRTSTIWEPKSLLCKRYNIAEPHVEQPPEEKSSKKKSKIKFVDYLEICINKKSDFQTPIIIPKSIPKANEPLAEKLPDAGHCHDKCETGTIGQLTTDAKEMPALPTPIEKPRKDFQPRTELEKQVVDSVKKPLTEKKDLFKCIFSDSDSESETSDTDAKDTNNTTGKTAITMDGINQEDAMNLLRNNSPPRGIFKSLFSAPQTPLHLKQNADNLKSDCPAVEVTEKKILFNPKAARESSSSLAMETEPTTYGPALPNHLIQKQSQMPAPSNQSNTFSNALSEETAIVRSSQDSLQSTALWTEKLSGPRISTSSSTSSDSENSGNSRIASEERSLAKKIKLKSAKSKKKSIERKHKKHKTHKKHKQKKKSKKDDKHKKKSKEID